MGERNQFMLTKIDKAKVVVTALHNLPELVTEEQRVLWKAVKKLSRLSMEELDYHYLKAKKILEDRLTEEENQKDFCFKLDGDEEEPIISLKLEDF